MAKVTVETVEELNALLISSGTDIEVELMDTGDTLKADLIV